MKSTRRLLAQIEQRHCIEKGFYPYCTTALYHSITDQGIHNKFTGNQYVFIIICMPLFGNHTFIELRAGVHYPQDSSRLSPDSSPDSCQWWMSLYLGMPVSSKLANPSPSRMLCGVLWPTRRAPLTLQQLHFSASKGTQIAVTSSTISILNKSSIQLWVSVPFLLGSLRNLYLLGIKHRQFSRNVSVFSCWFSYFKG